MPWNIFVVAMVCVSTASADGVLQFGNSRAGQNSRLTLPISIGGDVAGGVASLDFELTYDPQSVRVVGVEPGAASRQTGKQVQWHETEPGHMNVVVMGFNQETLQRGEVVQLTVEPIGDSEGSRIHVANSNFASTAGDLIPSRGSTASVKWDTKDQETPVPENPGTDTPDPAPEPTVPVTQPQGSVSGGAAPSSGMASSPSAPEVPASVEQRLSAARKQAESIRPLFGTSREAASAHSGNAPEFVVAEAETEPGKSMALESRGTAGDRVYPNGGAATTGTPDKKLENAGDTGHNTDPSDVLVDSSPGGRFNTLLILSVAVGLFVIFAIVRAGR